MDFLIFAVKQIAAASIAIVFWLGMLWIYERITQ